MRGDPPSPRLRRANAPPSPGLRRAKGNEAGQPGKGMREEPFGCAQGKKVVPANAKPTEDLNLVIARSIRCGGCE